jgi:nucleoside-diphosphate-sugar epimerase
MRVLLIGGTGFIGPHVAAALRRDGHDVTVFHRGAQPWSGPEIIGDRHRLLESTDALRAARPDVVVDLLLSSAAQARDMMTVFRGIARRVVALSSCDVYRACGVLHGSEPGALEPMPLRETSALRTNGQTYPPERLKAIQQIFPWIDEQYDKIPVEQVILGDAQLLGTVLRLPMVYGPGDPLHRQFPIVKRMDDRRPAMIFEAKHAAWRGARGYVENVAAAIALATTNSRAAGRTYNIADPDNPSELEWAREVARIVGWSGEIVVLPNDRTPAHLRLPGNLDQHWIVDSSRIREELGYREPVPRDEAIGRTVEWERANPPAVAVDPRTFDYDAEDAALAAARTTSA